MEVRPTPPSYSAPQKVARLTKLAGTLFYQSKVKKASRGELGRLTSQELQNLGPTFIKIGQFMSTRSDVFGSEFTSELTVLQDTIPPIAISEVRSAIPEGVFSEVSDTPLASASIGQVHYARLAATGEEVVIKFRRPNIERTIRMDFFFLTSLVRGIQAFYKDRQLLEVEILLREYYLMLLEEIDFAKERDNMVLFADIFKGVTRWLKVPKVFPELCTEEIIVMEYVPAIKINNTAELSQRNFDTVKITKKLVECYLTQIIDHGVVHIDPHPGNLGMTPAGKVVFYDYGMVLRLDMKIKENFRRVLTAIYDRDIEEVAALLIDLDIVVVELDKIPVFKKFLASFLSYLDSLNLEEFKANYIDRVDQSDMPFMFSSKFLMLLRGLSLLEGVCRELDPEFNYREVLDPFINDMSFDLDFLERRGNRDLSRFRAAPDKIALNEISVGIIEKDVTMMRKDMEHRTTVQRLLGGAVSLLLWTNPDLHYELKCVLIGLTFLAVR